jgi:hypothetical protein
MTYRVDFGDIRNIAEFVAQTLGVAQHQQLTQDLQLAQGFLERHADFLEQRRQAGWIRDVHGDLHAANIFLYPEPVVFDCIEFNDHFRQIDVLSELAFLCMDLDVRGHAELKSTFLKAYQLQFPVLRTGAEQAVFRFFKAYRANVRAKVAAFRAQQCEGEARIDAIKEMDKYLAWMHRYLEALHVVL